MKVEEQILRADVKKLVSTSKTEQMDFSSTQKTKKLYALVPERWHLASKIPPAKYRETEEAYLKMEEEDDCQKKISMLASCREFLAIQFRTMDIVAHIQSMNKFWQMPHGPQLLSACFEWVTNGSRDGSLKFTITQNFDNVFNMVHAVLSDMKGHVWDTKYEEEENNSMVKFGNDTMTKIFLLRDLAKTWKNNAEELIFIEGTDDISKISSQPFLHVSKVAQLGEGDFDERVHISLRVGNTVVFDDISLIGGLASLIEISFVFNLMYPVMADDAFQFVQRLLGNFGPADGARNEKGKIKKCFIDFQCSIGRIMIDRNNAKSVKTFIA